MNYLEQNLQLVKERIRRAALQAGRSPDDITLLAVSKNFPIAAISAAHALGLSNFGENRVEEAVEKIPLLKSQLPTPVTWHMIGHLQHRKVKDAVMLFDLVQSVDSVQLARRLERHAMDQDKRLPVLLEVNVSGEASKFGFRPQPRQELFNAIHAILELPHLDVQGLMTIAPIAADPEETRPFFRSLSQLRDELRVRFPEQAWRHLSMGMTDDYQVAITEGATIVRIGRAIFGVRS